MKNQILQKKQRKQKTPENTLTFLEHLGEIRSKLTFFVFCFVVFSVVGYFFKDTILEILVKPLGKPLYYSSPAGGFSFTISISIFFGFLMSFPLLVFQILSFIKPTLPSHPKKSLYIVFVSSTLLSLTGALFAYFISLPAALFFLNKFEGVGVNSIISTRQYLSFVTRYLLGFALVFQLPLIMLFINNIKRLTGKQMLSFEKWVILISFILAAILTPTPDIINQLIMALPLIVLYQISIALVLLTPKRKKS